MTASSTRFAALNIETAPIAAQPLLAASTKQFGFLPSPVGKAARSPALLGHLLAGFVAFDRTSLSALEREVVAFTVAFEMECHYCMALHTALLARNPENAALAQSLRDGTPLGDSRHEALRRFVQNLVQSRGRSHPSSRQAPT
jgi:AhpD family alkylhydroperoxidase